MLGICSFSKWQPSVNANVEIAPTLSDVKKIYAVLIFLAFPSFYEKHTASASFLNLSLWSSDKHLSSGSSYTWSSF